MSYGIEIINENSISIIDGNYSGFVVMENGTFTSMRDRLLWGYSGTELSVNNSMLLTEMLFVKVPIGIYIAYIPPYLPNYSNNSNSGVSAAYTSAPGSGADIEELSTILTYYMVQAFSEASVTFTEDYGLAVYNSAGQLAFSSQHQFFTILTVVDITSTQVSNLISGSITDILIPLPDIPGSVNYYISLSATQVVAYGVEYNYSGGTYWYLGQILNFTLVYTGTTGYTYSLKVTLRGIVMDSNASEVLTTSFTFPQNVSIIVGTGV